MVYVSKYIYYSQHLAKNIINLGGKYMSSQYSRN